MAWLSSARAGNAWAQAMSAIPASRSRRLVVGGGASLIRVLIVTVEADPAIQ